MSLLLALVEIEDLPPVEPPADQGGGGYFLPLVEIRKKPRKQRENDEALLLFVI